MTPPVFPEYPDPTVYDGPILICPECNAGKHQNCDGTAWDAETDMPGACGCVDPCHAQDLGFDLVALVTAQRAWSIKTFGAGRRTSGVLAHIRKELDEIAANPQDVEEWIDVVILALDGAWRAGYTPQAVAQALVAKHAKNRGRVWPDWRTVSEDDPIEHFRGGGRVAEESEHDRVSPAPSGDAGSRERLDPLAAIFSDPSGCRRREQFDRLVAKVVEEVHLAHELIDGGAVPLYQCSGLGCEWTCDRLEFSPVEAVQLHASHIAEYVVARLQAAS